MRIIFAFVLMAASAFAQITYNPFTRKLDFTGIRSGTGATRITLQAGTAPSAPAGANQCTLYADSATGLLGGIYTGGASCLPSGGSGATISVGTYASLPGTCTDGNMQMFTDSLYPFARCASNVWVKFYDGKTAVPPTGTWVWDNQTQTGSATVSTTHGYTELVTPGTHTGWMAARYLGYIVERSC